MRRLGRETRCGAIYGDRTLWACGAQGMMHLAESIASATEYDTKRASCGTRAKDRRL